MITVEVIIGIATKWRLAAIAIMSFPASLMGRCTRTISFTSKSILQAMLVCCCGVYCDKEAEVSKVQEKVDSMVERRPVGDVSVRI